MKMVLKELEGFETLEDFKHWLSQTFPELAEGDIAKIVEEVNLMLQSFAVKISEGVLKKYLEWELRRKATEKELKAFIVHVKIDIPQWLTDNAKSFLKA